jgi:hypothetical protein
MEAGKKGTADLYVHFLSSDLSRIPLQQSSAGQKQIVYLEMAAGIRCQNSKYRL